MCYIDKYNFKYLPVSGEIGWNGFPINAAEVKKIIKIIATVPEFMGLLSEIGTYVHCGLHTIEV